jgi:hypothetical protein
MLRNVRILALNVIALLVLVSSQAYGQERQGNLHLLVVGLSEFQRCNPLCGANDAEDVYQFYKSQEGRLFNRLHAEELLNHKASRAEILAALQRIRARVQPGDSVIVYVASHGAVDAMGRYFFLPYEYDFSPQTAIYADDVEAALAGLSCPRMLVLDTCYAGSAVTRIQAGPRNAPTLWQDLGARKSEIVTITACEFFQLSSEDSPQSSVPRRHGFFSRAFLEGVAGKADLNGDGAVTLQEIYRYLVSRLPELSGNRQAPRWYVPAGVPHDLPVAIVSQPAMPSFARR